MKTKGRETAGGGEKSSGVEEPQSPKEKQFFKKKGIKEKMGIGSTTEEEGIGRPGMPLISVRLQNRGGISD